MSERNFSTNSNDHDPSPGTSPEPRERAMTSTNALTAIAGTNGYQQHISIDRSQPLNLSVSNASGEIRISGSDQDGIWVVVRRADGHSDEEPANIPVSVDVDGNNVSVHPDWAVAGGISGLAKKIRDQLQHGLNTSDWDLSGFRLNPDLNYDIRVEIPRELVEGSKVSAKTTSGRLTIHDVTSDVSAVTASGKINAGSLRGNVSMNSASGSVMIEGVDGSLEVNAVSGGVEVTGVNGWTSLRTVSGGIRVDDSTLKHARIASVSGSVRAAFTANNAQTYGFSTVSGSVKLDVTTPATVVSSLTSRSASGSAQADGEWASTSRRSWRMGTGETGPVVEVKTVSGSMKCTGRTDSSVDARREPLPELQIRRDEANAQHDPVEAVERDVATSMSDAPDMDIDAITSWARDFAKDFKKNFQSLASPPTPDEPEAPRVAQTPVPPTPPMTPPTPPTPPTAPFPSSTAPYDTSAHLEEEAAWADETAARDEQSTTPVSSEPWSAASDTAAAPNLATETAPIEPEPANTAETAAAAGTMAPADVERLRVLEALERGEIDIDEALKKLDADDQTES